MEITVGQIVKEPYTNKKVRVSWIGDTPHCGDMIVAVESIRGLNKGTNKYFLSEIKKSYQ